MYNQTLFLREATENDAELLFGWVNEENVRKNSIRQEPVTWDNHIKWLAKKLNSPETKLFILCSENEALGQIRVDKKDLYWEIDYSVDYQYRGKGLGKEIVRLLIKKLENYKLKATVKKQNKASINVFVNLGFKKIQIESDDFEYFEY
ncbi:GNAT family N-acetyltransferase [Chryseobacterium sp.]|uniref:GNAT family N-acetyltransferase n=1 Tax=Chryseobacterium sp. TaxID=1871047 RepID=UPI001624DCCE|nr:GNAT family N-acetyltransferase [Chryseobacterium sp.]